MAFKWLGYIRCSNSRIEWGFEKVALYADGNSPTHMARQLSDGTWTSKCGGAEDITHFTLDALESPGHYGFPLLFLKRPLLISAIVRGLQWLEWKIESSRWGSRLGYVVWKWRQ
jgi:hypothetical protein